MRRVLAGLALLLGAWAAWAETVITAPFPGVTHIYRTESQPRPVSMHVVLIDLATPALRFKVTAPSGTRETVRERTVDFLEREGAQIAINAHFFLPWPSEDREVFLVGLAASEGRVYSAFEAPSQSYAIVSDAPALNLDRFNRASIVTRDPGDIEGLRVRQPVELWNAVSGSAQIVTAGIPTIPLYLDDAHPKAALLPGGPDPYSNADSWYERLNARTAIGLKRDGRTLVLFTVDRAGASLGMSVSEVARLLARDYGVWDALNLDGGGSTTLAMRQNGRAAVLNQPAEGGLGRAVGSNLGVFLTQ